MVAAGVSRPWKQPQSIPQGAGSGDDDGSERSGRVSEEEPLLREQVADFIGGIDFRDGTGPSVLPPNEVSRAFLDAENFTVVDEGVGLWSRLTGDDGRRGHHQSHGGEGGAAVDMGGVVRGGGGGSAGGRRRRVVHVESATTGKFFKVRFARNVRAVSEGLDG
ncbi:unnamed protein product [Scytosiphon promiscuus]